MNISVFPKGQDGKSVSTEISIDLLLFFLHSTGRHG